MWCMLSWQVEALSGENIVLSSAWLLVRLGYWLHFCGLQHSATMTSRISLQYLLQPHSHCQQFSNPGVLLLAYPKVAVDLVLLPKPVRPICAARLIALLADKAFGMLYRFGRPGPRQQDDLWAHELEAISAPGLKAVWRFVDSRAFSRKKGGGVGGGDIMFSHPVGEADRKRVKLTQLWQLARLIG